MALSVKVEVKQPFKLGEGERGNFGSNLHDVFYEWYLTPNEK